MKYLEKIGLNARKAFEKLKVLRHAGTTSDYKKVITNNCIDISLNHNFIRYSSKDISYKSICFRDISFKPNSLNSVTAIDIISESISGCSDPKASTPNWWNWRKRPFCGLSLLKRASI